MEDVIEVVNDNDSVHTPTESKDNETSKQIATINPRSLSGINLFDERQLVAAENFITKIMRSDKGGIKSVNDGLAILMRAQDLNLPFSSCIEHIHVINGKTGLDIHIIKALLSMHWRRRWQPTPVFVPEESHGQRNLAGNCP